MEVSNEIQNYHLKKNKKKNDIMESKQKSRNDHV